MVAARRLFLPFSFFLTFFYFDSGESKSTEIGPTSLRFSVNNKTLFFFLSFRSFFHCTMTVNHSTTVRTGIIGPDFRTLELPLLVWSDYFFFFFCLKLGLRRSLFAVRSPPYPREGISNVLA